MDKTEFKTKTALFSGAKGQLMSISSIRLLYTPVHISSLSETFGFCTKMYPAADNTALKSSLIFAWNQKFPVNRLWRENDIC